MQGFWGFFFLFFFFIIPTGRVWLLRSFWQSIQVVGCTLCRNRTTVPLLVNVVYTWPAMNLPSTMGQIAPDQIWRAAISDQEEHELEGFLVFHWFLPKKINFISFGHDFSGKKASPSIIFIISLRLSTTSLMLRYRISWRYNWTDAILLQIQQCWFDLYCFYTWFYIRLHFNVFMWCVSVNHHTSLLQP